MIEKLKKKRTDKVGVKLLKKVGSSRHKPRTRPTRKHVRALFCVMTKYIKKKNTFVFSDNISMGGVFLESFEPLPCGSTVKLRFPLKSVLRPVEIQGKVVWNRTEDGKRHFGNKASGMAIAFQKVKRSDMKFLKECLDNTFNYGWFLE